MPGLAHARDHCVPGVRWADLDASEDYLEAILVIRGERGWCRNVDIAERLGVTRPSVTKALAGLSSRSHVAGIAAANGGAILGSAPGAQLLLMKAGIDESGSEA